MPVALQTWPARLIALSISLDPDERAAPSKCFRYCIIHTELVSRLQRPYTSQSRIVLGAGFLRILRTLRLLHTYQRAEIEAVVLRPDELKKSSAGRKPFASLASFNSPCLVVLFRRLG